MSGERHPSDMTDQELLDASLLVSEQQHQPFYTDGRRQQIGRKLNHLLFELRYRNDIESLRGVSNEAVGQ